jgi:geranylgeranyl diphosphate synthase, type II
MQDIAFIREIFLEHIQKSRFNGHPQSLYEPFNYLMELGGKRMRPVLLLLAHGLYSDDMNEVMDAALAVEVFHNFTLAHDDIMDQADLRRGKPTVHEKFGTNTAILCGDLMMIYAYNLLSNSTGKSSWPDVFKVFNEAAIQICEGQQMDMEFETREEVELDEYLQMIKFKTAVLLGAAMKIGAMAAGASNRDSEALYRFAVDLGIAFQIKDDWLDSFGNPQKFGKKFGGDIARNKKTFLWIKCMELCSQEDKETLKNIIHLDNSKEEIKISETLHLYNKYGISELTEKEVNHYSNNALAQVEQLDLSLQKKDLLTNFANALLNRDF